MKKINKVVIPIAGLGTRMLPATKAVPKEMLPLAGRPIIHYIVNEVIKSGFSEIILVSSEDKTLIERYFEPSPMLESTLKKTQKRSLLKEIKEISEFKIKIRKVNQKDAKGLGHAILCAESLISDEPFAVILPDMVIDSNYKQTNLALMKKHFEKSGLSSILFGKVKKTDVQNYGIAKIKKKLTKNDFFTLGDLIEKPIPKNAPSNLFAAGRYIFNNEILSYLKNEKPDSKGEIQLTGAVSNFLKDSKIINGLHLKGKVHDCGNRLGYLIANLAFSFKDKEIKKEVLKYLKK